MVNLFGKSLEEPTKALISITHPIHENYLKTGIMNDFTNWSETELAKYIDHTNLKPTATINDIRKLCLEAKAHKFYGVCVHGCHLPAVKEELEDTSIKIVTVVGFPLGAMSTKAKEYEAQDYMKSGADEIDMVINIGWLKSGKYKWVKDEISAIKEGIGAALLKVIVETCYLTDDEKKRTCTMITEAGADYIKTSTGFGTQGAFLNDIALFKKEIGEELLIKASGGIKNKETALQFVNAGVSRIGTSSGIAIVG